ncbi:SWIM-type domain-containing protein [Trichonephila clavata]|uniref:SWIM-type domain-containing protein n=1 Tax=Trichonephila clavata TaxID=2740835 RepID=A0A8X6LH54_TRICU|nr:SWIM-type domain-containing protein [Trichonephila clavata]
MEFQQEIIQKNYIVSQLQEFYPYCIEDTDKSTPEQIVLRTNLQNEEEAENFKKHYSAISNTNWIVYNYNPNPQKFVNSFTNTFPMGCHQLKPFAFMKTNFCTTVKFHDDHLWAVLLVTPPMKRNHPLSASKEIILIDSTASCETSSSTITIMLSATKVGALPLAVMIRASQCMQNYINAFELLKMNFPQCFGGQDHPDICMSDDSSAEKGALAAIWPEAKQSLCHFHVAQAEWRWLFSHKMMEQEEKSTFMKLFQAIQVFDYIF